MEPVLTRDQLDADEALPYPPVPLDMKVIYEKRFQKDLQHIANGLRMYWKCRKPNETTVLYQYGFSPSAYVIHDGPVKQEFMKSYLMSILGSKENAMKTWMDRLEKAFPGFRIVGIKENSDWNYTISIEIKE